MYIIIIGLVICVGIIYCCTAISTKYDQEENDRAQENFFKEYKK